MIAEWVTCLSPSSKEVGEDLKTHRDITAFIR